MISAYHDRKTMKTGYVYESFQVVFILRIIWLTQMSFITSKAILDITGINLEEDSISYLKIVIPCNTLAFRIMGALANQNPHNTINVLVRYDGIPTIKIHDKILPIQIISGRFKFAISYPNQSVVYMAFWGGKPIHSLKYFSGSPEVTAITASIFLRT